MLGGVLLLTWEGLLLIEGGLISRSEVSCSGL